ncbi:MAG: tetratricopeptide repeat-containing sensor histidine kinase [Agriterribacter sp.]
MVFPGHKTAFALSNLLLIGLLFTVLCGVFSCNSYTKDNHPEYFNPLLHAFDTTSGENRIKALSNLNNALQHFRNPGAIDRIEVYKRNFEYAIDTEKDYQKAFYYADSMQLLSETRIKEQKMAVAFAGALFRKGDAYSNMKNYDEGIRYYIQAKLFITQNIKDKCELSGFNGRIANLVFRQGKYLLAAEYYREGYTEEQSCQKDAFLKYVYSQGNLNNVGLCYYRAGLLDSASTYFTAAFNYIEKNEAAFPDHAEFTKTAKAVINASFARIADKKGNYEQAESLYISSIEGTLNDDIDFARTAQTDLADMYIRSGKLDKAETLLREINPVFNHLLVSNSRLKWNRLLSDLYARKNEPLLSYKYLRSYISMRDSLDDVEKKLNALDVVKEFENKEQRALNQHLQKENEVKSFQLTIAILIAAIAALVIASVWYNLKRSANHVKALTALNDEVRRNNQHLAKLNNEIQLKNEDINKAFISLEQSHAENNRLTRMVAHDLKNPIGGIRSLVHTMLRKEQPEDLKEMLELIQNASTNSITLINDLLTDQQTSGDIRKDTVDMKRLLEYCVGMMEAKANEKNQTIELETNTVLMIVNRQKMWRVISNLIHNAIKFSPNNSTIKVRLEKNKDTVLLTVADQGIGIPEELKGKIFTAHPEPSRLGTAGEESHGLGLYISRNIIEEHQGKLWFESEAGKGSVFYVELPYTNNAA